MRIKATGAKPVPCARVNSIPNQNGRSESSAGAVAGCGCDEFTPNESSVGVEDCGCCATHNLPLRSIRAMKEFRSVPRCNERR